MDLRPTTNRRHGGGRGYGSFPSRARHHRNRGGNSRDCDSHYVRDCVNARKALSVGFTFEMRMLPEQVDQQDKTLGLSLEVSVAESRGR